ncbi:hypothetical protein [Lachnoclostridium sp.]|nr:hypothetical protein [Lachnoclostridium sp.]
MSRIIVIDISGCYASIIDEEYCVNEDDIKDIRSKYPSEKYCIIKVAY